MYDTRLGLHLTEIAAAKAYDRVAIKKWGPEEAASKINYPLDQYNLAELDAMDMNELVTMVRGAFPLCHALIISLREEQPYGIGDLHLMQGHNFV